MFKLDLEKAEEPETLGLRGKAGGGARVTAGPKRPHLSVCPGHNFPLHKISLSDLICAIKL